jgi:hypothetical protein
MKLTISVESNTERAGLYLKLLQSTDALKARLEQAIEDALTSELQKHVAQPVTRQAFTAAVTRDGAD